MHIREGCEKKKEKVWSFAKLGGGGVSDGSKMPNFYFGKVFFQLACRIILGPPKHVLHLVSSCLNIYLALKTTLKVSLLALLCWLFWPTMTKHRKNCECCHHHSIFKGHNVIVHIVVLNCQKCNQCLQCQVSGHKSLGLLFEGVL